MAEVNKEKEPPKTLVKYYECNEFSVDALKNNYLWAANPLDFNDPFDSYKFAWEEDSFTEEIVKSLHFKIEAGITMDLKLYVLENLVSNHGIVSLNAHSDNEDLFWGYYSKQQGFAIEFNQINLTNDFATTENESEPVEVRYDKLKTYRLTSDLELLKVHIKDWMSLKKKCWDKENEWRYIFTKSIESLNQQSRKKCYSLEAVSNVTLGFKFFERRFLTKTDFGYKYDLYETTEIFKYQIIRSLICKGYSVRWIHLNNDGFKVEATPIKLEFINPFELGIITK